MTVTTVGSAGPFRVCHWRPPRTCWFCKLPRRRGFASATCACVGVLADSWPSSDRPFVRGQTDPTAVMDPPTRPALIRHRSPIPSATFAFDASTGCWPHANKPSRSRRRRRCRCRRCHRRRGLCRCRSCTDQGRWIPRHLITIACTRQSNRFQYLDYRDWYGTRKIWNPLYGFHHGIHYWKRASSSGKYTF